MSTASIFDRFYERYDEWYKRNPIIARNELETVRFILALTGYPESSCIEVGVGSGWFASRLGCTVGVDPSLNMLLLARSRGLEVIAGRGEALPLASGRIPVIAMIVTICFVDDLGLAIREVARALINGGSFISCIVPRDSSWGEFYRERAVSGHPFYSVAKFYSVDEIDHVAEEVGLRVIDRAATLSFNPWEDPVIESPHSYNGGEGFVCTRYVKP